MSSMRARWLSAVFALVLGGFSTVVSAALQSPVVQAARITALAAGLVDDEDDFFDDAEDAVDFDDADDADDDEEDADEAAGEDEAADDDPQQPADADDAESDNDDDQSSDGEDADVAWVSEESLDETDYGADEGADNADYEDDSWAPAFDDDEADDAIAVEESRWGEDAVFEVASVVTVDGEDGGDAADDGEDSDSTGVGKMMSLRLSRMRPASGARNAAPRAASAARSSSERRAGSTSAQRSARRGSDDDEDTPYSFGGLPVSALSVPWQAQIFDASIQPDALYPYPLWLRQHRCGGVLIAKDWVLTAAHCIDQQKVDKGYKVRLGANDIARGDGVVYRIDRIVRHSRYLDKVKGKEHPATPPNMYYDDVALIRIAPEGGSQPLDPKRIREIPINRQPLAAGVPITVTGWGAVGIEAVDTASAALLRIDLRLMDTPVCQQRPGYGPRKIHDQVFCAAHPKRATCKGDSGGPVVLTNGTPLLVGIVSWGRTECSGDGRPGVYTRIDRYAAWIEQAMRLPPDRNALP